ncbi:SURF1 family protein [Yimella sp. cx-51]|uniref:SURF1 family protein n=1 Tax=Yimella sp. cx-51 TaxID=2770551 RepID=UPI00165E36EA|nr:SURF1 family protein [Yimella sp. cx-51]MBC9958241.1 SURF1 family protein [Yimella sp. cx-51]QTH38730.1 SURF1 family protein [Yimella sp. cx-51]
MLRRLFTPRWIAFLILLAVAVGTMGMLGLWQLNVSKDRGTNREVAQAPSKPVAPIIQIVQPQQPFPGLESSRRVSASGTYDASKQLLVPERRLDGVKGYWVMTPLTERTTGARLVVVRGFVTSPAQATPPRATDVTVVGGLAPAESPVTGSYPPGQIGSVAPATLLNQWGGQMFNAFVFAISETPNATDASVKRIPPPPPNPTAGFKFVNLMYAFQWWIFAIFACYVFWRMLRDDVYGPPERAPRAAVDNGPEPSTTNDSKETHV